jgi:hypothetical protein
MVLHVSLLTPEDQNQQVAWRLALYRHNRQSERRQESKKWLEKNQFSRRHISAILFLFKRP